MLKEFVQYAIVLSVYVKKVFGISIEAPQKVSMHLVWIVQNSDAEKI